MRPTLLILGCLVVGGLSSNAVAVLQIYNAYTDAFVSDGTDIADSPDFALSGANVVATLGGYSSTTNSMYSTSGNLGNFSATLTHVRQGGANGFAYSQFEVDFTTAVDSTYTASGNYSNSSGVTTFVNLLYDNDLNADVYKNNQAISTGAAMFTLGGPEGDTGTPFIGSLTGYLPAGSYSWLATVYTQAEPTGGDPANAFGTLSLSVKPVPELSSAIAWLAVALAVGVVYLGVAANRWTTVTAVDD
jgi:hypothetical protein